MPPPPSLRERERFSQCERQLWQFMNGRVFGLLAGLAIDSVEHEGGRVILIRRCHLLDAQRNLQRHHLKWSRCQGVVMMAERRGSTLVYSHVRMRTGGERRYQRRGDA